MYRGFVKSWRKTEDSQVWRMPPLYHRVWIWLLWRANHTGHRVPMGKLGIVCVNPGQVLTSLDKIAEGVHWYERHLKRKPNKKTIHSALRWFEQQGMIVIEKTVLTVNSPFPPQQRHLGNAHFTLITIVNWHTYQGLIDRESNDESNDRETIDGHKQELERMKKKKESCANLASLTAHLGAAPGFSSLPSTTRELVTAFMDKLRTSNKTVTLSLSKINRILGKLVTLVTETSTQAVDGALSCTLARADQGKFSFNGKRDQIAYVRTVAKSKWDEIQQKQKPYAPVFTDTDALYE